jgi:branched-chain amino acid transport system substrate-binding protein
MRGLEWPTPQGTKIMRAGDHQAVQKMYVVRVDKGKFNIIGEVPGDQAIGPVTCTRW